MASKQRRRLYEGFGVLEQESKIAEENSTESHDNPMTIVGKSQDNHEIKESAKTQSYDHPQINHETIVGKSHDYHEIKYEWFNFSKLQQNILISIYKNCRFNASLTTTPIRSNEMAIELKTTINSVRKTIYNLMKLKTISKHSFKDGPSGWSRYNLNKEIYDLITIEEGKIKNPMIIMGLSQDNHEIRPEKNPSYSSYISKSNTTTEEEKTQFSIGENLCKVGIGQKQLLSILNLGTLSFDDIQSSLDQYSYDLSKNKKANLALFFGILRKGSSYVSQEYTRILELEISKELDRINRHHELEKEKIKTEIYQKNQAFKNSNPQFLEEVRKAQTFNVSEQVLENLAFARFSEIET